MVYGCPGTANTQMNAHTTSYPLVVLKNSFGYLDSGLYLIDKGCTSVASII